MQLQQQLQVQLGGMGLPNEGQLPAALPPQPDTPPAPPQPAHMGPLPPPPGVGWPVQERQVQMEQQQQMQLPVLPLEGQLPGWQLPELPRAPPYECAACAAAASPHGADAATTRGGYARAGAASADGAAAADTAARAATEGQLPGWQPPELTWALPYVSTPEKNPVMAFSDQNVFISGLNAA